MDVMMRKKLQKLYQQGTHFQNFDFGRNWDQVVHVLKTNAQFRNAIQQELAYDLFQNDQNDSQFYISFGEFEKAHPNIPPSAVGCDDTCIFDIIDMIADTRNHPLVSSRYWRRYDMLFNKMNKMEKTGDQKEWNQSEVAFFTYSDLLGDICHMSWETNPYFIVHWVPFGRCHFFNRCFSFPLANLLFPQYNWEIVKCEEHTTVVSTAENKVFDILCWGSDDRLQETAESVVFGEDIEYTSQDETFGGNLAIEMLCQGFGKKD